MHRTKLLPLLALAGFGCTEAEAQPVKMPPPAPTSADAIAGGSLGGTLLGEPFTMQSAHYFIDHRLGFEHLEISFSPVAAESPCGEPRSPSVWLRRTGRQPLEPTTARLSPGKEAPWEAHYQVQDEHGWYGNGDASALIIISKVAPDMKVSGELWACFADTTGSCVSGSFTASHCSVRLYAPVRGSEAMERLPAHANPRQAAEASAP